MQFKEENYRLKNELNEHRKKNEVLELSFHLMQINNVSTKKSSGLSNSVIVESENEVFIVLYRIVMISVF